jgi:CMP-N-acetylneuraminic acid synthetase
MEILGLIPARGGSKGIPGKNLAPLAGRPLLAWTCEAARGARALTRVVVSTEDDAIAAEAERCGVETLRRPPELAADDTPMLAVVAHALEQLGQPDAVVLLQPTSPLRRAAHVDAAVALWRASGADSVVSVVEVPHQFTPASLLRLDGDRLHPYTGELGPTSRHEKERLYARNGPAIVVTRPSVVRSGRLYGDDLRAYPMSARDSVDVDGPEELALAVLYLDGAQTDP